MDTVFRQRLRERDDKGIEDLYFEGTCSHFFSVDWREDDAEIVRYCAQALAIDNLTAEWRDGGLFATYGSTLVRIPLEGSDGDRHITVCALNDLLGADFEIRYFIGSHGGDTGGFVALPLSDWQCLENECPLAVKENFSDPRALSNTFTELVDDAIPEPAKSRFKRMVERKASGDRPGGEEMIRVVLHRKAFDFSGVDRISILGAKLDEVRSPIPFGEGDVEEVQLPYEPAIHALPEGGRPDYIHRFKRPDGFYVDFLIEKERIATLVESAKPYMSPNTTRKPWWKFWR